MFTYGYRVTGLLRRAVLGVSSIECKLGLTIIKSSLLSSLKTVVVLVFSSNSINICILGAWLEVYVSKLCKKVRTMFTFAGFWVHVGMVGCYSNS